VIGLRPAQMEVFQCEKRFRVLVAGRRFGKTQLALVELLRASCGAGRLVWYVAPNARQAKRIAWNRLKQLTQPFWYGKPNESDLSIRMRWGGVIALRGADQYDALRGSGLDFVVLDEYASMRPECWTEVLRPALADRRGGALFIGTPYGSNHLQERFEQAMEHPEWGAFRFTTLEGGNVSAEELASAAGELDEKLFRQEFEASFEGATYGQTYYAFSRAENVRRCEYQAGEPLLWSLDFNVHPMCSVLAQCDGHAISVLDEIVLADANTLAACEELARRVDALRGRGWGSSAPIQLDIYGDASGHQRRTSGTGTDWSLIREFFDERKGRFRATLRSAKNNPGVRDRVNLVNAKLCSAAGERRLFVDPQCRELLRDLERVRWKADATGRPTSELDKSDRMRTHVSDALGYYVAAAFERRGSVGERGNGRLM
jgi:Terminase large subunit, T4likevirus-type, N-terminal